MSEEYEKWNKSPYGRSNYAAYDQENIKLGWMACEEAMQAKLDAKDKEIAKLFERQAISILDKESIIEQQAKELETLRGALETINKLEFKRFSDGRYADSTIKQIYRVFRLIDENGNPTPLLTGDK